MTTATQITDVLRTLSELFPVGSEFVDLVLVSDQPGRWASCEEPTVIATFRVVTWDRDPGSGTRHVRNVKEQEVVVGWPAFYEDRERVQAFCQALELVVSEISTQQLNQLMPADLIDTSPLELRKAQTKEDFETALRAKKRLGRWLGSMT